MDDIRVSAIELYGTIKPIETVSSRIDDYAEMVHAMQFQLRAGTRCETETRISGETRNTQKAEHSKHA